MIMFPAQIFPIIDGSDVESRGRIRCEQRVPCGRMKEPTRFQSMNISGMPWALLQKFLRPDKRSSGQKFYRKQLMHQGELWQHTN